jgi:type VI secretion system protein VasJ
MLGIIGSFRRWRWAAYGKHPVAGDFFRLGAESPLAAFFSDWMERGYPVPGTKKSAVSSLRIWRFWARDEKKKDLACGFIRDSNDSFGRPYPLLIIGAGPVDSWDEHWDLVPCACEKTWSYIEYSSTRNVRDPKQLEGEIRNTPTPRPDWIDYRDSISGWGRSVPVAGATETSAITIPDPVTSLCQGIDYELFLINTYQGCIAIDSVVTLHRMLKGRLSTTPHAIFIGGSFDAIYVVCFKRPLQYGDFAALWSVPDMGSV